MSESHRRLIQRELRKINDQLYEVWTDDGKDIVDAVTNEPLELEVKVDQEGNIRFFDASENGRSNPALIIRPNGPLHEDGRPQLIPDTVLNPAIEVFAQKLSTWQDFIPIETPDRVLYKPAGTPGLAEAPPGVAYKMPRPGKPDDMRESRSKDYGDGTEMHEYNGRYNGSPFIGHEITTYGGLILARYIEYDQPQKFVVVDTDGSITQIDGFLIADCEFRAEEGVYETVVTTIDRDVYRFGIDKMPS